MTILKRTSGLSPLAYKLSDGNSPAVIFCPGFNSSMQGNKAMALELYCLQRGQQFIRFDYSGHGASGGDFAECTISTWLADALAIVDELTKGDVILVGSSMGAWIALLAALKRPNKVSALLLIACAADMTKFYPGKLSHIRAKVDDSKRGYYSVENNFDDKQPYRIFKKMLDDGAKHCVLDAEIDLSIPVTLLHGKNDDVVSWQRSQDVASKLLSSQLKTHWIDDGDHRLSRASDLAVVIALLQELLSDLAT